MMVAKEEPIGKSREMRERWKYERFKSLMDTLEEKF
jgi:hypothetical protein